MCPLQQAFLICIIFEPMKCYLLLIGLLVVSGLLPAQTTYGTGEVFDPEFYNTLPLKAKVSTRSLLPVRASVEAYCPTPGNQGDYMTCSAWSSALSLPHHHRSEAARTDRPGRDR